MKETEKKTLGLVLGILLVFGLVGGVFWWQSKSSQREADAAYREMRDNYVERQAEKAAAPKKIKYRVSSISDSVPVSLTYQNKTGGTSQEQIDTPWSYSFTANPGDFLYLSGQTNSYGQYIKVELLVDGSVVQSGEASEPHAIATVSGKL